MKEKDMERGDLSPDLGPGLVFCGGEMFLIGQSQHFSAEQDSARKAMDHIERGDEVKHEPSGETWAVKRTGTDSYGAFVEPAGWPPSRARAIDCTLLSKGKFLDKLD